MAIFFQCGQILLQYLWPELFKFVVFTVSVGAHSWVCVEGGSINCRSMYGLGEVLNAETRTVVANDWPHI